MNRLDAKLGQTVYAAVKNQVLSGKIVDEPGFGFVIEWENGNRNFNFETCVISRDIAEAQANENHVVWERKCATQKIAQTEKSRKRKNFERMHDRLYDHAMALAVDEDDMDVVEHYCQGNIGRLQNFISARI